MTHRKRLSELALGESATIVAIETAELQVALMSLGVIEGDSCMLCNVAPLGDPIAIHINGTKISLRKKDAQGIITISNKQ
jgi:ferrous iron transport protein A